MIDNTKRLIEDNAKMVEQVKEELAYPVRAAFEDRSLRIPSDPFIRSDLRAVKKETTSAGNIRFTADRGKNGHADRFWAKALATHAGKQASEGPIRTTAGIHIGRPQFTPERISP
jgi:phage FluMu gp28-like protein